jgi:hypothetical protein
MSRLKMDQVKNLVRRSRQKQAHTGRTKVISFTPDEKVTCPVTVQISWICRIRAGFGQIKSFR